MESIARTVVARSALALLSVTIAFAAIAAPGVGSADRASGVKLVTIELALTSKSQSLWTGTFTMTGGLSDRGTAVEQFRPAAVYWPSEIRLKGRHGALTLGTTGGSPTRRGFACVFVRGTGAYAQAKGSCGGERSRSGSRLRAKLNGGLLLPD